MNHTPHNFEPPSLEGHRCAACGQALHEHLGPDCFGCGANLAKVGVYPPHEPRHRRLIAWLLVGLPVAWAVWRLVAMLVGGLAGHLPPPPPDLVHALTLLWMALAALLIYRRWLRSGIAYNWPEPHDDAD